VQKTASTTWTERSWMGERSPLKRQGEPKNTRHHLAPTWEQDPNAVTAAEEEEEVEVTEAAAVEVMADRMEVADMVEDLMEGEAAAAVMVLRVAEAMVLLGVVIPAVILVVEAMDLVEVTEEEEEVVILILHPHLLLMALIQDLMMTGVEDHLHATIVENALHMAIEIGMSGDLVLLITNANVIEEEEEGEVEEAMNVEKPATVEDPDLLIEEEQT